MTAFPQSFTDQLIKDTGAWSGDAPNTQVVNLCQYTTHPSEGRDVIHALKLKGIDTLFVSANYLHLAIRALENPEAVIASWLKPIVDEMKAFSGKEQGLLLVNFNTQSPHQKELATSFVENPQVGDFNWTKLSRAVLAPSEQMNGLYERFKKTAIVRDFSATEQEFEDRLERLRFKKGKHAYLQTDIIQDQLSKKGPSP